MEAYIDRNKDAMKARFKNPQVGHYLNLVDDLGWRASRTQSEDSISAGYALKKKRLLSIHKINSNEPINRHKQGSLLN